MSTQWDAIGTDRQADGETAELVAQLELLETENERLRQTVSRLRRAKYRHTALGLAAIGGLALIGAALFPVARTVLIALGGTGLFAAVFTRFLTPERFVSASVGQRVYESLALDRTTLVDELELQGELVYAPVETAVGPAVRLFVPHRTDYRLPADEELESMFVLPDDDRARGVAFKPTGHEFVGELRSTVTGGFADDPARLADQVADGLTEAFELADSAVPDVDRDTDRISMRVTDSAYGPVDRLDHPIASIVATTLAAELDAPVTLEVTDSGGGEYLVTCRWS